LGDERLGLLGGQSGQLSRDTDGGSDSQDGDGSVSGVHGFLLNAAIKQFYLSNKEQATKNKQQK
jgi:hypothetical protein